MVLSTPSRPGVARFTCSRWIDITRCCGSGHDAGNGGVAVGSVESIERVSEEPAGSALGSEGSVGSVEFEVERR